MATPLSVTERFEKYTSFDIVGYLSDYVNFMEFDYPNVSGFYSGIMSEPNVNSFSELDRLRKLSSTLNDNIKQNNTRFQSTEDWDLLEKIEEVRVKLDTIDKFSKWFRSSVTRSNYNPNPEIDHSLKQHQTLEALSRDTVGSPNPQEDSVDIALRNDLREEDYTSDGGVLLKVSLQESGAGVKINTVVDNMTGESLYGLDLPRVLEFSPEDSDFVVLSFKDTVRQAIDILAELRNNDNPEFPTDGISQANAVGVSQNAILFPLLFRQLYNTFQKDDTLSTFSITNIRKDEDYVAVEYEVQTRLGELIQNSISL